MTERYTRIAVDEDLFSTISAMMNFLGEISETQKQIAKELSKMNKTLNRIVRDLDDQTEAVHLATVFTNAVLKEADKRGVFEAAQDAGAGEVRKE